MRLQEADPALYGPLSASRQEPNFIQCGRLIPRDGLELVQVVTELGGKANGYCADLRVVDVPADVCWAIEKTRGGEHVSERHRTGGKSRPDRTGTPHSWSGSDREQ